MSGRSVFRPPTPEPEEAEPEGEEQEKLPRPPKGVPAAAEPAVVPKPRPLTVQELVGIKLVQSRKKEQLKELLRKRLLDCGWRDSLKVECRSYIRKSGRDNVSTNDVVRFITPKARALVPGPVKAELLQEIQALLRP